MHSLHRFLHLFSFYIEIFRLILILFRVAFVYIMFSSFSSIPNRHAVIRERFAFIHLGAFSDEINYSFILHNRRKRVAFISIFRYFASKATAFRSHLVGFVTSFEVYLSYKFCFIPTGMSDCSSVSVHQRVFWWKCRWQIMPSESIKFNSLKNDFHRCKLFVAMAIARSNRLNWFPNQDIHLNLKKCSEFIYT